MYALIHVEMNDNLGWAVAQEVVCWFVVLRLTKSRVFVEALELTLPSSISAGLKRRMSTF
jgi:hypothetical protein